MPQTGVPADVGRARAHTRTEQWQSFEIRMRHRRAERCLLRAEAALDAGLEAEARAALDEASGLIPETPSFDELLAAAQVRRDAEAARKHHRRMRRAVLVAAAALVISSLGIGWAVLDRRDAADVEELASAAEPITPRLADATSGVRLPESSDTQPSAPSFLGEAPAAFAEARATPPMRLTERSAAEPVPEVPVESAGAPPPASASQATTDTVPRPPVEAELPSGALGAPVTSALSIPTMNVPAPKPAPALASMPEVASEPAEPISQEPAVRAVLDRFAEAYSSLSVSAAREVWPSVDARSLSRAFDGLESQQVSLGNCSVKVAASTARAECSGSATWAPRVGGGRRTDARRWEFDLAQSNGAWLIVQARAR